MGATLTVQDFEILQEEKQLQAVRKGRMPAFRSELGMGVCSTLHYMINSRYPCSLAVYKALVAQTSLDEPTVLGHTPLTHALQVDMHDLAMYLIGRGARLDKTQGPLSMLKECCASGVVPAMFEHGAGWLMNERVVWHMDGDTGWFISRKALVRGKPDWHERIRYSRSSWRYYRLHGPVWNQGLDTSVWTDPGGGLQKSLVDHFCRFELAVRNTLNFLPVPLQDVVQAYMLAEEHEDESVKSECKLSL